MSPRQLLPLPVPKPIVTVAIVASAQAPPATTSDTASDPNVSNNHSLNEVALDKLPGEIIITKMQSSKTNSDLSTPALVELNNRGVPASVVKAIMTPRTLRRDAGVTGPI